MFSFGFFFWFNYFFFRFLIFDFIFRDIEDSFFRLLFLFDFRGSFMGIDIFVLFCYTACGFISVYF